MKRAWLALLLCVFLTGCSSRQLEEEMLVIVLTVDQRINDTHVSIKTPGNAEAQEEGRGAYLLLEASGSTFGEAMAMLNATTPRKLNFSQTREVIISRETAVLPDFCPLLKKINALPRFRCSAPVIVCKGKAVDFSKAQKPYIGVRLSRYTESTLTNFAGKGFTPKTTLCDAVRDLGSGLRDPLLILGAVNDFSGNADEKNENGLDAQAGELQRKSPEAVEVFGAAMTDGKTVCGELTGYEMALIHLLEGHVEALVMQGPNEQSVRITASRPARLSVDLEQSPAVLSVRLSCEAVFPPGQRTGEAAIREKLGRDVTGLMKHMQEKKCDGLGFGGVAVRTCLTIPEWESLHWRETYAAADVQVEVNMRCRDD